MKIIHISDTHLGYAASGYQKLVDSPLIPGVHLRQGEADIMLGLIRAIDIILERLCPDVVVHSGDLFDTSRPTARMVDLAMTQLKRITDAGIPVVLVEGNHSSPRDRSHGHVVRLLGHLPGVTAIAADVAQVRLGKVLLHACPHYAVAQGWRPSRDLCDSTCANILVTHGVADALHFFRVGRPAAPVAVQELAGWYDYVGLGHYHRFSQVPRTEQAFYAGATAMVTWQDFHPGYSFGVNLVDLNTSPAAVTRHLVTSRPMHAYGLDDAEALSPQDVLLLLARQAQAVPPDGACCRVVVERLDPLARRAIAIREVESIFAGAAMLTISLRAREQHWDTVHAGLVQGGDPMTRFAQLVTHGDGDEAFKADVLTLGQGLLEKATQHLASEATAPERAVIDPEGEE